MSQPVMSKNDWDKEVGNVVDQMKVYTRPFVTPLVHEAPAGPTMIGSATYLDMPPEDGSAKLLLTCEHVIRHQPQLQQYHGTTDLADVAGVLFSDRDPTDAATVSMSDAVWLKSAHAAAALPFSRLAPKHAPAPFEVFFFRGLAAENAYLGANHAFDGTLSGFGTQERPGQSASDVFDLEWSPAGAKVTPGTPQATASQIKYDDPSGYSGSLVWNTRFVEGGCDPTTWRPEDAEVTGLLQRWDTTNGTLVAWKVEHLREWLLNRPVWAS